MDGVLGALGGLGLFLLGMLVLTDGLRVLAGDAPTRALARFTHSPASGALTGATSPDSAASTRDCSLAIPRSRWSPATRSSTASACSPRCPSPPRSPA